MSGSNRRGLRFRVLLDVMFVIFSLKWWLAIFVLFTVLALPARAVEVTTDWLGGVPEDGPLAYEVLRKGKRIGFQHIQFEKTRDGALIVTVHIELEVKFGPIPLFRYVHHNRELWRDGKLYELNSRTDNNGRDEYVALVREGDALVGEGTKYAGGLTDPIMSTNYFNPNFVRQTRLISTQDGRLLTVAIKKLGVSQVPIPDGPEGMIEAAHFRLLGKLKIDIWYTSAGRWVRTEFTRGESIIIQPVDPASLPPRGAWRKPFETNSR